MNHEGCDIPYKAAYKHFYLSYQITKKSDPQVVHAVRSLIVNFQLLQKWIIYGNNLELISHCIKHYNICRITVLTGRQISLACDNIPTVCTSVLIYI